MDRRQFIRAIAAMGGLAAAAPLLDACARNAPPDDIPNVSREPRTTAPTASAAPSAEPTSAPHPSDAPALETAAVALVSTTNRAEGVRRAMKLLGTNAVRGRHVLVKPNLNSADPAPGSTHRDVLRAIVTGLSDSGARSIAVGDRAGMGDTRSVMRQTGVLELAKEFGLETIIFDELADDDWHVVGGSAAHWRLGFPVPTALLDADRVVQTCNLKTHGFGGHFSLSLKNSVGFVAKVHGGHDYMRELHDAADMRKMIAEVNTAYAPTLVVVDGVEAFVKGGPATGTTAPTGVVLAGSDRVAIDAVGVAILRLFGTTEEVNRGPIFRQGQIARAVELGLGVAKPENIMLVTDDGEGERYAARVAEVLLA